ncbi:MAG: excinuclease ABC subunit UvrA, partial [Desulfobulbaceae bacterium]|nr:excinuclease ABC subunit UvrA [Desulfobulbaceae bacterium]
MHNLRNIDLDIPRNKLIVFTGVSGSGKSSLAFDTLYAEGQRRYVESLSTYARQFLGQMDKPDVDLLEGLSPAVSIEQKTTANNPRSTVGTVTEIYDYLRLFFARAGAPHCPKCERPIHSQTPKEIVDALLALPIDTKFILLAPLVNSRKGNHEALLAKLRKEGYVRVRIDGKIISLQDDIEIDKNKSHTIEAVIDRLVIKSDVRRRLEQSVATTLGVSKGVLTAYFPDNENELYFSEHSACRHCGISLLQPSTRLFSFNNPQGACRTCSGLGVQQVIDPMLIVPDSSLSLEQGAIAPWNHLKLSSYSRQWIYSLALHYQFDPTTPFNKLSPRVQEIILHGSGKDKINFYKRIEASSNTKTPFEGVLPRLERLYLETGSRSVREEIAKFMRTHKCSACKGARLTPEALSIKIDNCSIYQFTTFSIDQLCATLRGLTFPPAITHVTNPIIQEITNRLSFLQQVGLGYITLNRGAGTLSGGEAQRIRLASQIGSGLAGVMYILDEPSIGLHQRDNMNLINTLEKLRDLGNTVVVVEHDTDTILAAD